MSTYQLIGGSVCLLLSLAGAVVVLAGVLARGPGGPMDGDGGAT